MARRIHVALVLVGLLELAACGGGSDGEAAIVGVAAPSITTQPASTSVAAGASATLTVVASGGGTLSYQWYLNGTAIAGATGASLSIGSAASTDAGSYHVVVTNSAGSVTSSTVVLTVTVADDDDGDDGAASSAWNLATGAQAADAADIYDFPLVVTINLASGGITASSTRLAVGAEASGVTPIALDGQQAIAVTRDTYGLTIDSDVPDSARVTFELEGAFAGSLTFYSQTELRLVLDGASIASPDGPAINIQSGKRTFLVLADGTASSLSDSSTWSARYLPDGAEMDLKATLFSEGPLLFSGTGSLAIDAATKHAIASDDHVRVVAGSIDLLARKKDGIRANDAFVMDGGSLAIETSDGAGKGIKVDGKEDDQTPLGFIAINAGTLSIRSYDKAITASWEGDEDGETATTADDPDPRVTINGGTLDITTFGTPFETASDSLSPEGIESKSTLRITGGEVTITTTDDAINAGQAIVIGGGRIYASSSRNDAVDSNGTLSITGGVLVAIGASGAEGGLDCDQNTFTVTGGTFVGIGGRNSTPTRAVTTQNTVSLRGGTANSLLVLRDGAGNAAFAYTVPASGSAILLGSPAIAQGTAYTVVTGGTLANPGAAFHGLYPDATTHSGGTAGTTFTPTSTVTSL